MAPLRRIVSPPIRMASASATVRRSKRWVNGSSRRASSAARPMKSPAFLNETAKPRPASQGGHVEREIARKDVIALLQTQRVERAVSGVGKVKLFAEGFQRIVDGDHVVRRHVQFPAQLAHHVEPDRPARRSRDIDLSHRAVGAASFT